MRSPGCWGVRKAPSNLFSSGLMKRCEWNWRRWSRRRLRCKLRPDGLGNEVVKMNCTQTEKKLVAYLDGKLHAGERREFEAHLASCGACGERAEGFRAMWDVLEELPPIMPSPGFDSLVRARVQQEAGRGGFWSWISAFAAHGFCRDGAAHCFDLALVVSAGTACRAGPECRGAEQRGRLRRDQESSRARGLRRADELRRALRAARAAAERRAAVFEPDVSRFGVEGTKEKRPSSCRGSLNSGSPRWPGRF